LGGGTLTVLTKLLHTGMLATQETIVFGNDKGFNLNTVADWPRTQVKCPILTGLPFGHVPTKVCLPVGKRVEVLVQGREALVVWGD
jgi:muramoyltetrapeptide carboxypeptidase